MDRADRSTTIRGRGRAVARLALGAVFALGAILGLSLVEAPGAWAQYGPAGSATASDPTIVSGATIVVSATACTPGQVVRFALDGAPLGQATTGADGVASATVTVHAAPGDHVVTNTCNDAVVVLHVGGPPAPAPLPRTGATHVGLLVRAAILAITGGWLLLVWSRRHLAVPPC